MSENASGCPLLSSEHRLGRIAGGWGWRRRWLVWRLWRLGGSPFLGAGLYGTGRGYGGYPGWGVGAGAGKPDLELFSPSL